MEFDRTDRALIFSMVRFVPDIFAPAVTAFASGGLYGVAIRGAESGPGETPKWALVVPGMGAATSLAAICVGERLTSVGIGSFCASFSTVGWLASKMFVKRGA